MRIVLTLIPAWLIANALLFAFLGPARSKALGRRVKTNFCAAMAARRI